MKAAFRAAALLVCSASAAKSGEQANPLDQVLVLISDLQQEAIKEGEETQKSYKRFADFCDHRAHELTFQIKSSKAEVEDLSAVIEEQLATIAKLTARTESLGGDVAGDVADLKKATDVRKQENSIFLEEEKELMNTVDMLKRAISAVESGASMLQLKNAGSLAQTFSVMVQASLIGTADASKLTALIQATQGEADSSDDEAFGAPAAAAYEGQSGGIVDTLEDLLDKADAQLDKARNAETDAQHNFQLLKQGLGDEVLFAQKDMDAAKKGISAAQEKKSGAEGDLGVVKKDLAADTEAKRELHHDCLSKAQGFESEVKSRDAELEVLAKAKAVIKESIGGASLAELSFVQVSSKMELSNFKAVRFVRDLGHKKNANALVQLAAKMAAAMRSTARGDQFDKVKGMIQDMIEKLNSEASAAAQKEAYCKKELGETEEKKEDTADDVEELDTKVDQLTSEVSKLREDVSALQNGLSELTSTQAEMDQIRAAEREKYGMSKAMIEKSLAGTKTAIKVLKDYFSQDDSSSSSSGASTIISLLESIESKFSAWLMDINSDEESADNEYKAMAQENHAEYGAEKTDLNHKTKEIKTDNKKITETSADEDSEQEQLSAVSSYLDQIRKDCRPQPESFEERQKSRQDEIEGLKEALRILEDEGASLLQQGGAAQLRGAQPHRQIDA